ncbi:shikimate dehydrogenase [Raineyella fluvialis]|uniref:Shikimate dehydrogenase (NADP(+)) n=1 Tax=Raineyella fluvialis TaxID=2662261 RepID=A0A5Q2F5Y0_9ACTN|nr:shikimate dehydrogenase [Raineyella fluvialis]QGF22360.1 shikimate dehydrogenase [Raineyella fluvialis]
MFEGVKPVTHMLGLVGDSISASFTPPMHEMAGPANGMSIAYRPIDLAVLDVGPEDLAEILVWARRLGFTGLNITAPCKQSVIPLLDGLSERATALGAVNTVVFRDGQAIGHNTDWCGFAHSFSRNLPGAAYADVVLMGAGGAGSAVAYGMLDLGVEKLTVFEVDPERGAALVERMGKLFGPQKVQLGTDLAAALASADGVINATTYGMTGHQEGSCVPAELLRPAMWVADCVYLPLETPLIASAREVGCRTLTGGGMAVEQAAEAFRVFTGVEPDAERMYEAFDRLVEAKGKA